MSEDDDPQVIFEALNGHGAQLHATDLIRNFVFMRADREKADLANLYDIFWSPLESAFWTAEQRRGRLKRPRLEWFVQASLQAELGDEIDISRLYVGYKRFAAGQSAPIPAAEQVRILNGHSENYRQLISESGDRPIARFGRRTGVWDTATTHSLALVIAKSSSSEEQNEMFDLMVSYLVRRAVCSLTTKNYNIVFIHQLKKLTSGGVSARLLKSTLASLEGDASRWPCDAEFRKAWMEAPIYDGRLDAAKTKALLCELENGMRSARSEEPFASGLENLDVDHILPVHWHEHWPLSDGTHAEEMEVKQSFLATFSDQPLSPRLEMIQRRELAKTRIGNLTLFHYGVSRGLQHYGFHRKRQTLFAESNLHLNRSLMVAENWDESEIDKRGRELFDAAKKI